MTLQFPSFHEKKLPSDIKLVWPEVNSHDTNILDRITGSLVGLAIGDALGASVEFRPHQYLVAYPVTDMVGGGTWGLQAGQWTDDTSMALCLASSLITQKGFNRYDQMVRYKWWYKYGYLSSTGQCFDIGNATRTALEEFYRRQMQLKKDYNYQTEFEVDQLLPDFIKHVQFNVNCSEEGVAGNGALMRLAPVPLFFCRQPPVAVEYSGQSARLTHGDNVAFDACRYYGALIVAAVNGEQKESLISDQFYDRHQSWFSSKPLHNDIIHIAKGSFKRPGGYKNGIRGKGHIVSALEAALWAFWSADTFEKGALNAVNLGDDTDTTAAIYGQLAGAHYGYHNIPTQWIHKLYANQLIICVAEWIAYLGRLKSQLPEQPYHIRNQLSISSIQPCYMNTTDSTRPMPSVNGKKSKRKPHHRRSNPVPKRLGFIETILSCGGRRKPKNRTKEKQT
ncbi:unnamed protein product [Rotaria sp. Silwood1]|nr:unnamed protein product [Rotaria sp. Silwood1]CAF1244631.1 unnamed protein product [Rotaria sp. Silwood1]CAF3499329.1 unnamed protein product [Rotaria sp. Silwood1]CAF3513646.1 unnamed protein product [Rotaria sp. Silwood1]CAF3515469.1 unnamed protein product [Rotaria sp. Silwood1]